MSNSNGMYNVLNIFKKLQPTQEQSVKAEAQAIYESVEAKGSILEGVKGVEEKLTEKYLGFKKTAAAAKAGGAEDPEAVAASIGRKKYGKKAFQKAAAAGTKMDEEQVDQNNDGKNDFEDVKIARMKAALKGKNKGVAEGSNDYFKRRKDEEDRIAGKKAPAKRTPRQTDYEKKRREQGVAEEREENPTIKGTEKKAKSVYNPTNKPGHVKRLDKPTDKFDKIKNEGSVERTPTGLRHKADELDDRLIHGKHATRKSTGDKLDKSQVGTLDKAYDVRWDKSPGRGRYGIVDPEISEVAPPGKKAEKMVKTIKAGYANDGKLTDKEKGIAYATAWKAHNAGKVEETRKRQVAEGINFAEMMKETDSGISEMLSEIQADIDSYKKTGHCSDKLEAFLKVHNHGKRLMGETVPKGPSFAPQDAMALAKPAAPFEPSRIQGTKPSILDRAKGAVGSMAGGLNKALGHGSDDELLSDLHNKSTFEDVELNELARLAGLNVSESINLGELATDMESHEGKITVNTNSSSDGTKSVNISADGAAADQLMQMLKLAGMESSDMGQEDDSVGSCDTCGGEEDAIAIDVGGEEEMDEATAEYANVPKEEYQGVDTIIHQGDDMNREKKQFKKEYPGDNPMAVQTLEDADPRASFGRDLMAEYQALKLRK